MYYGVGVCDHGGREIAVAQITGAIFLAGWWAGGKVTVNGTNSRARR